MKTALLALSFLIATFGAVAQTYQVMTYNVRNNNPGDGDHAWPYRKDKVASIIQRADIVGLQEVLHGMLNDLDTRMQGYAHVGVGRDNGKKKGEYAPIFYKTNLFKLEKSGNFWLSETPEKTGSKGWDAACKRICTWALLTDVKTQRSFYVFNTHFDHKGIEARKQSALLITKKINEIAAGNEVILLGDFNMAEDNPSYSVITASLTDAAHSAVIKTGPVYSDCGFKVANTKCSKIDYIFFKGFKALTHHISDEHDGIYYPSDHLPVSATMQLL